MGGVLCARVPPGPRAPVIGADEPRTLDLFGVRRLDERSLSVAPERTGWRDADISARHRLWGASCPAVDLDFVLAEIHLGEPVAIVEYKHHLARPVDLRASVYRALRSMADRAGLPFIVARYWKDPWAFRVKPVNSLAKLHFRDMEDLSERAFVTRLYRMRRLVLARELEQRLSDALPPQHQSHRA